MYTTTHIPAPFKKDITKKDITAALTPEASDVLEFVLSDLSLQRYLPSFRQHGVNLNSFLTMTHNDFESLGVEDKTDRQRLFECAWGIRIILRNGPQGTPKGTTMDDEDEKNVVEALLIGKSKDTFPPDSAVAAFSPSSNKSSIYAHSLMSIVEDDESVFELALDGPEGSRVSVASSPPTCKSSRESGSVERTTKEAIRFSITSASTLGTVMDDDDDAEESDRDVQFRRNMDLKKLNGDAKKVMFNPDGNASCPVINKSILKVKLDGADVRRHSLPVSRARDNMEEVAKARASWQGRITPRPEEGCEELPSYECTVNLMGYIYVKRECDCPGERARDRSWKKLWLHIWGTQLRIYKFEPRNPDRDKPTSVLSMQHAEATAAINYHKRKHVLRLRTSNPQFLIRATDHREMVTWIEHLQASSNISLCLDDRPMPKFITIPRRQRRLMTQRQRESMREQDMRNLEETLL
ncbi:hypothetical protein BC938DRAFT_480118 [Jimgerdemannia flammicorona]|uniref:PH domain-containing protein n=1 Tax=Jimgerdemannia flammicorona TaxID=994334 RepID=A0A433QJC6_9FUNG|nr:hypothetical protein BC938DRAFT_480118 [Jimgerdemannia flammicorona]